MNMKLSLVLVGTFLVLAIATQDAQQPQVDEVLPELESGRSYISWVSAQTWSSKPKQICHEDYDNKANKSLWQCQMLCNSIPGCPENGFSYVPEWKSCRMPRPNKPCKAGAYDKGAFYTWEHPWPGQTNKICHDDYDVLNHKKLWECKLECASIPGCPDNGFSYVPEWKSCRMPRPNKPCKAGAYDKGTFYTSPTYRFAGPAKPDSSGVWRGLQDESVLLKKKDPADPATASDEDKAYVRCVSDDANKAISICNAGPRKCGQAKKMANAKKCTPEFVAGLRHFSIGRNKYSAGQRCRGACMASSEQDFVTFSQAQAICEGLGMHLPSTIRDLQLTEGTGCNLNRKYIWYDL